MDRLSELLEPLDAGKHSLFLDVSTLRDGSPVNVPVLVVKGALRKKDTVPDLVALVSGQHGNEWNGTYICRQLFARIDPARLKTTVIMVPIANPLAFREGARVSSIDHIDMNRVYGSPKKRKPTEYLAMQLFEDIYSKCQAVFDLHSGGPGEYLPFAEVVDTNRGAEAAELGFPAVLVAGKHAHSLGHNLEKAGVASFTVECGKGRDVDADMCESMIAPILRYLSLTGRYNFMTDECDSSPIFKHREMIGSPENGVFFATIDLGARVQKGDLVGRLEGLLESTSSEITADRSGIVSYIRREPIVSRSESLFHLMW